MAAVACELQNQDQGRPVCQCCCICAIRALPNRAYDAFYSLSNPRSHIQVKAIAVIGAMVATRNLDEVFQQQNVILQVVVKDLQQAMFDYGYDIERVLIINIKLDERIEQAMIETNAVMRKAVGEADPKKLSGQIIARQHQAIADAAKDFSENIPGGTAKDFMDMVLMLRYIDAMKEIGATSKSSMVFIPQGPGAMSTKIHDGLLQASTNQ